MSSNVKSTDIGQNGGVVIPPQTFVMGVHTDKKFKNGGDNFVALFTNKADETVSAEARGHFVFNYKVKAITMSIGVNNSGGGGLMILQKNEVDIPATQLNIPAGISGDFDLATDETFLSGDSIRARNTTNGDTIGNYSYYLQCEAMT